MTGDEHYKQSEVMLVLAQMDDLPYQKAVVAANVAQTHALLAQIASARELGVIQQAGIDAFRQSQQTGPSDGAALPVRRDGEPLAAAPSPTWQQGFDDCALHLRKQLIQLRSSAITAERQDAYDKAIEAVEALS